MNNIQVEYGQVSELATNLVNNANYINDEKTRGMRAIQSLGQGDFNTQKASDELYGAYGNLDRFLKDFVEQTNEYGNFLKDVVSIYQSTDHDELAAVWKSAVDQITSELSTKPNF